MKKILLSLLIFICLPCFIAAEDKVFPESDAIWNVHVRDYDFHQYIYGLSGDTIINDKKYNKLYFLNDTILPIGPDDSYFGGLREENKQVWFLPYDSKYKQDEYGIIYDEFILYDFSKEEGDTFIRNNVLYFDGIYFETAGSYDEVTTIVHKVEHTSLGKEMHVEYYPSWSRESETVWIEGIGSTRGILWDQYIFPMNIMKVETKLACFKKGNEVIYNNNEYGDCFCDKPDVSIDRLPGYSILVFPDKGNRSIQVVANKFPLSLEIFDLQGQRLLQEEIVSHPQSMSYKGMEKGIYIYRILDEDTVVQTGKMVLE